MPFKSEAQRRKFHAMAGRGEISKSTVHHWEEATHNKKKLPYHVKESMLSLAKTAVAMNAFEDAEQGIERKGLGSVTIAAFLDELEKLGAGIVKEVLTKGLPKIRPHVNPQTILGGRPGANTIGRKAQAAVGNLADTVAKKLPTLGGTSPGVSPKSLTGGTTFRPPSPTPQKSHLLRNLAIGGGLVGTGAVAGHAIPSHQQQQ